jgi:hypothetical protein
MVNRNMFPVLSTACLVGMLTAACGGTNAPPKSDSAGQATPKPASQAAQKQAVPQVTACSLLKKNEVDAAVGRAVLEPIEEKAAQLSTCDFGDPEAPMVAGRAVNRIAGVSVFSGGNTYYAGPVAQVAGIYDMALKNASDPQTVTGLGDKAFWANHTLRVLRGPYLVEIEVRVGGRDREISEQLMKTMLQRLPSGS